MNRVQRVFRLLPAVLFISWSPLLHAQCDSPVAILSALEGKVDLRPSGEAAWHPGGVDEALCAGDTVRVGANSRGALTLADHTLVRLGASTTATIAGPEQEKGFVVELLEGITHFMSRVPRTLEVDTPFVNAGVEGTEFLVRVDSKETYVSVFEGKVAMENEAGRLLLLKGQSASAGQGTPPVLQVVVRPRDAVQWALYYPPLLGRADYADRAVDGSPLARAIGLHSDGKTAEALGVLEQATAVDADLLTYRASLRLAAGRVDGALEDVERSLAMKPDNGDALALRSIVAVVQGEAEQALQTAQAAVKADPQAAAPRLALSYALQAGFQLEEALDVLREAAAAAPDNALVWARLAEVHLMFRNLDQALEASRRAVALSPDSAHAHMVLGFAQLIAMNTGAASKAFETAIKYDQSAPLPRLGLGLALIRQSELQRGRRAIEVASILDPGNPLLRSYLGKAYYEERRDGLAGDQYTMAEELDPRDPTPSFYNAILKQADNRPIEALDSMEEAIEKNDNRAVYRSRLLLDEDLATRGVSVAGIYNTLGFDRLARVEADRSLTLDPGNYSAHRFLADSYSNVPRHEIARASELLKSQLLQPLNHSPLQPHIAENDLFIIERAGAADAAYHEYHPLFMRNGASFQASLMGGSHGTLSDEMILAATGDSSSFSLGQYHYKSDGFRENNDLEHNIYDVFGQYAFSPKFSMQAEYRHRETEAGDLTLRFDPEVFNPGLRNEHERDTGRVGLHYQPKPGHHILASAIHQKIDDLRQLTVTTDLSEYAGMLPFDPVGTFIITRDEYRTAGDGDQLELQYLQTGKRFSAVYGVGYLEEGYDSEDSRVETFLVPDDRFIPVPPFPEPNVPIITSSPTLELDAVYRNAYAYLNVNAWKGMVWTLGASYDSFDYIANDSERLNPKAGLSWTLTPDTQLRAAWFKTTRRPITSNQTIEPTQIAGFNQFFDETNGSLAERYGIALDHRFRQGVYVGFVGSRRESEQPYFVTNTNSTYTNILEEKTREAYLFWTINQRLALSAQVLVEEIQQSKSSPTDLNTLSVPIRLSYFHPGGFYSAVVGTYVDQDFKSRAPVQEDEDQFWNVDATVGYKLPKRHGVIRLSVKNLFDRDFHYRDSNINTWEPLAPMYQPERTVLGEVRLSLF